METYVLKGYVIRLRKRKKVVKIEKHCGLGRTKYTVEVITLIPNPEPPTCIAKKKVKDYSPIFLNRNYEE